MASNLGGNSNNSKTNDDAAAEPARQSPRFLGSLRDALRAAAMPEDASKSDAHAPSSPPPAIDAQPAIPLPPAPAAAIQVEAKPEPARRVDPPVAPRTPDIEPNPAAQVADTIVKRPAPSADATINIARAQLELRPKVAQPPRTQLVRGRLAVPKTEFHQDPVVGWLVVVGGQGLGAFRPIFEGNNTVGRARTQRVAIDFGDEAISNEEQAYIRYDSADRSFLFVPNLSKTNVVSINNKKPTAAVPLEAMDVITMGRTQLAFVPFCGNDFDWSELADRKK